MKHKEIDWEMLFLIGIIFTFCVTILYTFYLIIYGLDTKEHKLIACPTTNLYLSVEDAVEFNGGIVFRVKGDKIRVMQDGSGCSIREITVERDK